MNASRSECNPKFASKIANYANFKDRKIARKSSRSTSTARRARLVNLREPCPFSLTASTNTRKTKAFPRVKQKSSPWKIEQQQHMSATQPKLVVENKKSRFEHRAKISFISFSTQWCCRQEVKTTRFRFFFSFRAVKPVTWSLVIVCMPPSSSVNQQTRKALARMQNEIKCWTR